MFKGPGLMRAGRRVGVTAALMLTSAACHGDIENLNEPDRARATGNSSDVEALIGGAFFPGMHNALNTSLAINQFAYAASDMVATLAGSQDQQQWDEIMEPRRFHNNGAHISQGVGPHGPRFFWAAIGRVSSVTYDGLQLIDDGMQFMDGNVNTTARAHAFAKFMQGWAWGYSALVWDKPHVVPESIDMPSDPAAVTELAVSTLTDYPEALAAAIASLEEAIAVAKANPTVVHFPSLAESPLWFGTPDPVSNQKFIQMANTLAARLLVLSARTPAERAAVDWQKVLQFTANGLTNDDFAMQLQTGRTSTLLLRIQGNTTGGTANARWNYRTIGPADQSGAYQAWIASPLEARDRFNIVTPDRRITGATPTSDGSYTRYRADDNGFLPHRGRWHFSAYQWSRHAIRNGLTGNVTGNNSGVHPLITADENRLLRAEALLRTGDRAGAAALINVTRTRPQQIGSTVHEGLPPVTAAGVPTVNGACVPRTDSGACADLLGAMRYERMIELAGIDLFRGYADSRGFGILADGSPIHFPVPGDALELYGLEEYSYGGVGGPDAAAYAPATLP
jgi:hypothetical protein